MFFAKIIQSSHSWSFLLKVKTEKFNNESIIYFVGDTRQILLIYETYIYILDWVAHQFKLSKQGRDYLLLVIIPILVNKS